jgi:serine/threonine protein kinase
MTDLLHQTIADYQIEALIAQADTGIIYRARHTASHELCALKIVHPAIAQDPAFRAAFRQQAAAIRALRHPHIVAVAAAGVEGGRCYLAAEWLPDGTLHDLLARRAEPDSPWSQPLALDLVRQAAEALDFAHAQGFVHGNITPGNLLLDNRSPSAAGHRLKVADFGLAWLAIHRDGAEQASADALTYAMAPERCQGLDIDGRADLYALGVILYEIATGRPPFEARTLDAAVYRHVYTQPAAPHQLAPDTPPELETIILRCLAKDPADRFPRAADLAAALAEVLRGMPAPAITLAVADEPAEAAALVASNGAHPGAAYTNGAGHTSVVDLVVVSSRPPAVGSSTANRPLPAAGCQLPTDEPGNADASQNALIHTPPAAPDYVPEDMIGQTVAEYQLEAYLGESETGYVYRARHAASQELSALKLASPALVRDPSFWNGFDQQAAAIRALRHPHIAAVAAAGVDADRCYIASEWLPDGTLRNLLQRRNDAGAPWSLPLALDLVRQAAEALDFAHAQGFVHGSIKPNNLLLTQQNSGQAGAAHTLKIADFGLAWLAIHREDAAEQAWADTLIYAMAPERCQGLDIDGRADLYALGVILYEIATGSPPFEARTLDAAVYRHVYTQPVAPRRLAPSLPAELETIILRCLAKDPADRFPRAADLAAALQALLQSPALAPRAAAQVRAAAPAGPAAPAIGPVALRVSALDQYGRPLDERPLTGDGLTIGSAADNDLVLDAAVVAPRHLLLDWDGRAVLATNISNGNGIVIGEAPLAAHDTRSWGWDEPLRLGPFWLRLEASRLDERAPAADAAASPVQPPADAPPADTPIPDAPVPAAPSPPADAEVIAERIGIALDQGTLTLTPGRAAAFRMTLANLGTIVDHFTVTAEQIPAGWVAGPPAVLQLNPGAQGLVTLNILVPQEPSSRAGDYPVTLRARSREQARESNVAAATWTVLPFASSSCDLKPKRMRRRLRGVYRMVVRNLGNAPARYQLSAADDEEALSYQFAEEQLALEPGASAKINLVVRPIRARWFGLSQLHRFNVQVKPEGDGEPQTIAAQLEQSAVISRWMIVLAALLLLAGLAALWLWYRPKITELSVDPPAPVLGQPFVVSWQVTNAPTVELRVNGTTVPVPPNESRQIFSGFASPPDIRLVARNVAYGQDSRNLPLVMISPTPTNTPTPTLAPTATATPTAVPPTPTDTPVPTATPVLPTATPAPTNTPTSQTLCLPDDFAVIRGSGPPLAPYLVYFDDRAVGGGSTDRAGLFSVRLGRLAEQRGRHSVVVRDRNTRAILKTITCIVP